MASLDIGDRIVVSLRKAHMTQTDLAEKLAVDQSTVSRWIRQQTPITLPTLQRIALITRERELLLDLSDLPDPDDTPDLGEPSSGWMNETADHGWCEPEAA